MFEAVTDPGSSSPVGTSDGLDVLPSIGRTCDSGPFASPLGGEGGQAEGQTEG